MKGVLDGILERYPKRKDPTNGMIRMIKDLNIRNIPFNEFLAMLLLGYTVITPECEIEQVAGFPGTHTIQALREALQREAGISTGQTPLSSIKDQLTQVIDNLFAVAESECAQEEEQTQ